MNGPSRTQEWLVRAAVVLVALPVALLVVVLLADDLDAAGAVAVVGGALVLVSVSAAPLLFRGEFRILAAVAAVLFLSLGMWALIAGGLFLLPAALLLGTAALVPSQWSAPKSLAAAALGALALVVLPFAAYGAYTCARPAPVLEVSFTSPPDAETLDRLVGAGYKHLQARDGGYRVEYRRGDEDLREAAVGRLEASGEVTAVTVSDERCD